MVYFQWFIQFHCSNTIVFFISSKLLKNIWIVSNFWLLWIMLLWTFLCALFGKFHWHICLQIKLLGFGYVHFQFKWMLSKVFQSGATQFYPHQQCLRVPSIYHCQWLSNFSHSGGYAVSLHCGLIAFPRWFPRWLIRRRVFSYSYWPFSYLILWKNVCKSFVHLCLHLGRK